MPGAISQKYVRINLRTRLDGVEVDQLSGPSSISLVEDRKLLSTLNGNGEVVFAQKSAMHGDWVI